MPELRVPELHVAAFPQPVWDRAGFSEETAREWHAAWAVEGCTEVSDYHPIRLARWRLSGFHPRICARLDALYIEPERDVCVREWIESWESATGLPKLFDLTYSDSVGQSPDHDDHDRKVYGVAYFRWARHGIGPEQADEWEAAGMYRRVAVEWIEHGVTDPTEAAKWYEAGATIQQHGEATAAGLSADQFATWCVGASRVLLPGDARAWICADLECPEEAAEWTEALSGVMPHPDCASSLEDLAETAGVWRAAGQTPGATEKWIRAGLKNPEDLQRLAGMGVDVAKVGEDAE